MKVYNYQNPLKKPTSPRQKYGLFGALDRNPFASQVHKKYSKPVRSKASSATLTQNPLTFQLIGIGILTVAIVLFFQSVFSASLLPAAAESRGVQNKEVRLLTNFQQTTSMGSAGQSSLQEIIIPDPKPEPSLSPESAEPVTTKQPKKYKVADGDSLYSISQQLKLPYAELAQLNGLEDPYTLQIGQELVVE
jgi:LysM repeat protein